MARIGWTILGCCLLACLLAVLPACQVAPAGTREQVQETLARWPGRTPKTFFVTLHATGQRATASGFLDVPSPADPQTFRITALTELGYVLFDVSAAGGTVEVRRILPGLPQMIVTNLCRDVMLALAPPEHLERFASKGNESLAYFKTADGHHGHAHFEDTEGVRRLRSVEIEVGGFDKLTVEYGDYDADGRPLRMTLHRPLRGYTLLLRFTARYSTTS